MLTARIMRTRPISELIVKIINHTNGLNNELIVFDPCPVCGLEVDKFEYIPDFDPIPMWGEPDQPWIRYGGTYFTLYPCGDKIVASFADSYTIYRFPKTESGKAGYNAQVHRKAIEASRKAPEVPDSWSLPL